MKATLSRRAALIDHISSSLWFIPALCTLAAAVLGFAALQVDRRVEATQIEALNWLIYDVGVHGARGILSAISSGIITVTGVVFSVTVVTLQLASTQYTPRVLQGFIRDRSTQLVLGTFIGTFTYCLVVLRTVRSADDDLHAFVPSLSVTIAVLLALLSIGLLIVFVHHIATSIQATEVVRRAAQETLATIDRMFPDDFGQPASATTEESALAVSKEPGHRVTAAGSGFVLMADEEALWEAGGSGKLLVRMERRIGEFVLEGETLATLWPAEAGHDREVEHAVREAFVLGPVRTARGDIERGLIQLSDIAVRALSPGINDPTTAEMCIDRLGEVLAALGQRRIPPSVRVGPDGEVRFIASRTDFQAAVTRSFDQVRHYGVSNPAIAGKLLDVIRRVGLLVPAERSAALLDAARRISSAAALRIDDLEDRAHIAAQASRTVAELQSRMEQTQPPTR